MVEVLRLQKKLNLIDCNKIKSLIGTKIGNSKEPNFQENIFIRHFSEYCITKEYFLLFAANFGPSH